MKKQKGNIKIQEKRLKQKIEKKKETLKNRKRKKHEKS